MKSQISSKHAGLIYFLQPPDHPVDRGLQTLLCPAGPCSSTECLTHVVLLIYFCASSCQCPLEEGRALTVLSIMVSLGLA